MEEGHTAAIDVAPEILQQPTPPPHESQPVGSTDTRIAEQHNPKRMDVDEETNAHDMLSPMSAEGDKQDENELPALRSASPASPSMGYDFSNIRVCVTLSRCALSAHNLLTNSPAYSNYSILSPTPWK